MDVRILQAVVLYIEFFGIRPEAAQGGPGRLLHHISQLARKDQVALPAHQGGLDAEDVPARLGPREAGGRTDAPGPGNLLEPELLSSKMTFQGFRPDMQGQGGSALLHDPSRVLPEHGAQLPFELPISYLTRLPGASLVHGCYAETIALSMAGRDESFSLGQGRISPERITEMRALARDAGIGPAPLLWGQHHLSEAEVDSFARLASAPGKDAA